MTKHIKTPFEGVTVSIVKSAQARRATDTPWDDVAQASLDSFPASDPPSWIARGSRPAAAGRQRYATEGVRQH
ncbi:MAG: hypothetical protein WBA29_04485 [Xanthobacteraceae bacterium]